eukprot:TRINITY_DN3346_c0_g2_i1.p1 TRINITY_DN3346_c0_g2~~TRINITY_DN3346_c0_g2_i1.p1  ORF type:complete len:286 (-),score=81.56 TRINITY_DN3346_c0_g2_i1:301-1158(-)
MAAVALYTVEGVEDDSADHPNAFFLPRLQGASITLEQLRECFPLGHIGEFKFSYLVQDEPRYWRTLVQEHEEAPLDAKKRLFLRVLPVRDWNAEAQAEAQAQAQAQPPATPATKTTDELPSLAEFHTPASPPEQQTPKPTPPPPAQDEQTPEEKACAEMKDEGNKAFKVGGFPAAITAYSKAIEKLVTLPETKVREKLMCDCLGNRAACRIQERDFELAIEDCDIVLQKQPNNTKALVRRGTSYEHCEKLKKALADFEAALALDMKNKTAQQSAIRLRKLIKAFA